MQERGKIKTPHLSSSLSGLRKKENTNAIWWYGNTRNTTQRNTHNTTQHTQHNATQRNTTQHTQHMQHTQHTHHNARSKNTTQRTQYTVYRTTGNTRGAHPLVDDTRNLFVGVLDHVIFIPLGL
jgi:hypothetical protein